MTTTQSATQLALEPGWFLLSGPYIAIVKDVLLAFAAFATPMLGYLTYRRWKAETRWKAQFDAATTALTELTALITYRDAMQHQLETLEGEMRRHVRSDGRTLLAGVRASVANWLDTTGSSFDKSLSEFSSASLKTEILLADPELSRLRSYLVDQLRFQHFSLNVDVAFIEELEHPDDSTTQRIPDFLEDMSNELRKLQEDLVPPEQFQAIGTSVQVSRREMQYQNRLLHLLTGLTHRRQ